MDLDPRDQLFTDPPGAVLYRVHASVEAILPNFESLSTNGSSLGRYVFGSEISYNKPPPRLPGLGC
jgi:hypothetical protein